MNHGDPPVDIPVFHITHWKAGSQWVRAVLAQALAGRVIRPTPEMSKGVFQTPIAPGVYTPLYSSRGNFAKSPAGQSPHRKFIVIRDLRDTLVSWYFSLRSSHPENEIVDIHRATLTTAPVEEGLLALVRHRHFQGMASIPASWEGTGELMLRYEDMVADPHATFGRVFDHCGLDLPDSVRRDAVDRCAFETLAGRPRGQEDPTSHYRKGIAGDWKNHFTPKVSDAFKELYGSLLVRLGYETNRDW